jgi:hypothetical protein
VVRRGSSDTASATCGGWAVGGVGGGGAVGDVEVAEELDSEWSGSKGGGGAQSRRLLVHVRKRLARGHAIALSHDRLRDRAVLMNWRP